MKYISYSLGKFLVQNQNSFEQWHRGFFKRSKLFISMFETIETHKIKVIFEISLQILYVIDYTRT